MFVSLYLYSILYYDGCEDSPIIVGICRGVCVLWCNDERAAPQPLPSRSNTATDGHWTLGPSHSVARCSSFFRVYLQFLSPQREEREDMIDYIIIVVRCIT